MAKIWIVAAGGGRARIFESAARAGPLTELRNLTDPSARQRARDIDTDAPGRSFDSFGRGRHAMAPRSERRQQNLQRFAADIADVLNRERRADRFDKLYLLAEPKLMGLLRAALDDATRSLVAGEIDRNLSVRSPETIRAHLPDFL